ncbi:TPA: hypothetical protein ACH3X1_013822 [Trebouxia sp. C0004]
MPPSPLSASRSVSPDSSRAVSEQATLIEHLLGVARQLATQHQSLAGECHKETEAHEALLASRDAEIERVLAAEVNLRQNYEQQLLVERQQWCQEKDALQKVLQEQQGTAHSLEQHLNEQIAVLQATLDRHESIQENMARTHQGTLSAMQAANEQLQQQQSKLEQDLKAALAYRHKCIQQKQELQLLKQANQAQPPSVLPLAAEDIPSDDQHLNLTIERQSSDAGTADADAFQEDPMPLVGQLKRERELIKRAYNEEKKKADRYRNAYTQLRDMRQPVQRRSKQQRSASGAQSMPQLPGHDRQQGNAFQLATDSATASGSAAALACNSSKPQKPSKVRKGPTEHNRFTAEMDLAAAGLLGQASKLTVDPEYVAGNAPSKQLLQGLSWPFRSKRVLQQQGQQQQQQLLSDTVEQQEEQQHRESQRDQQTWQHRSRQQQQHASNSEELSPGAKEALILAGLLSEDQEPMLDYYMTEDPGVLPSHHNQLPTASTQQELQPWQARLAGHAEGIQQLDRDSLCRLSDPCQQPSKRSRSCPPDSFGAEAYQPAESTEATYAMQDDDPISDGDDAMSAGHSGLSSAEEPVPASDGHSIQQQQADALAIPAAATLVAVPLHVPAAQPAQQHDSLDLTQPNLTPAGPRQKQQPGAVHDPDSDPRTGPIRACPSSSPRRSHVDLDPDVDCDMLPAAETSHCHPQLHSAVADQGDQMHRPVKQRSLARQTSAPPRVSKVKAAKWKQRGGQCAAAFAENDQPAAAVAVPRQQGGEVGQQCWLQSGVGGHEVPAVLGQTAQRARVGGDFKYQEVVRGKADRAALQVVPAQLSLHLLLHMQHLVLV